MLKSGFKCIIFSLPFLFFGCFFQFGDGTGGFVYPPGSFLAPGYETGDSFAREIQIELNKIRHDPQGYAEDVLTASLDRYQGYLYINYEGEQIRTEEGINGMKKLIKELKSTHSLPLLEMEKGLYLAARHLSDEQAQTGATDGKTKTGLDAEARQKRYGRPIGLYDEVRLYGNKNARDIVISLLLDDGKINKKHRKILLNRSFRKVGIGFSKHYYAHSGAVAILDFADDYISD